MKNIPENVLNIIKTLNSNGYEAYVVGGCIRDSIIGKTPYDWDIATNASPDNVKNLFENTADTGIKHGTITVIINNETYEITTYRIDGKYIDNRRPENVRFTNSLEKDLARRDFTINAIAFHPKTSFFDPFDGIIDIKSKVVRCVGNPNERFVEDALRMIRAVRFSAQLGFEIESVTFDSIYMNSSIISKISSERIQEELTKIITSDNPSKLRLLVDSNIMKYVIPEFVDCFDTPQNNPNHIYNVGEHILCALENIENNPVLRWTMLLHDIGKPVTRTTDENNIDHFHGHQAEGVKISLNILKRLKFDNKTTDKILRLVKYHDRQIAPDLVPVRRAVRKLGDDIFSDLLKVKEADYKGQGSKYTGKNLLNLKKIKEIYKTIKESSQCVSLNSLVINGSDLINLGMEQGPRLGKVLNSLLDEVIDNPSLNNRNDLINIAKEKFLLND